MSECPECGSRVTWRNIAVRCLDCGRTYCKECPDYRWGRFQVRCPDCRCTEARALANAGGEASRPPAPPSGERSGRDDADPDRPSGRPTPFVFR